jgi:hypothetical protein
MDKITCNTCTRADHSPFREYDAFGKVINGCVDACHTDKLVSPSESSWWHSRKEAVKIRAITARAQKGLGYK